MPLNRLGQICCMATLGGTIAVPATGVLNIFTMDMGKADLTLRPLDPNPNPNP